MYPMGRGPMYARKKHIEAEEWMLIFCFFIYLCLRPNGCFLLRISLTRNRQASKSTYARKVIYSALIFMFVHLKFLKSLWRYNQNHNCHDEWDITFQNHNCHDEWGIAFQNHNCHDEWGIAFQNHNCHDEWGIAFQSSFLPCDKTRDL